MHAAASRVEQEGEGCYSGRLIRHALLPPTPNDPHPQLYLLCVGQGSPCDERGPSHLPRPITRCPSELDRTAGDPEEGEGFTFWLGNFPGDLPEFGKLNGEIEVPLTLDERPLASESSRSESPRIAVKRIGP
jgi:hypothetical protein